MAEGRVRDEEDVHGSPSYPAEAPQPNKDPPGGRYALRGHMLRDDVALYLNLAPEFGGGRFGPFEGLEVRLGADRERCHVVLPESFGVARDHCKIMRQGDGGLILTASERTAAVFVWKGDARRPTQIQTPTAVRSGDSFALVSPEGAKFTVELASLPPDIIAKRNAEKRGRRGLTGEKLAREGFRMALARLWAVGPVGIAMRGWYMVKSGTLWQPRIIITAVIAGFGYIAALAGSCSALKFKADAIAVEEDLDQCKQDAGFSKKLASSGIESQNFAELAATITGSATLGHGLQNENGLRQKVEEKAKSIAGEDASAYDWMFRGGSSAASDWIAWRERVAKDDGFDEVTKYVLPYAAAVRKRTDTQWNNWLDVTGAKACLRGPARLSYRQAKSFGLAGAELDAFKAGDSTMLLNDDAARAQLLVATATSASELPPDPPPASELAQISTGQETCVFASGDDEREKASDVLSALRKGLGTDAAAVPESDNESAGLGRLLKLYAADAPDNHYAENPTPRLDFRNGLATPLKEDPAGEAIVGKAAEAIARSIVLPCMGTLNAGKEADAIFGRKPEPVACLVLMYRLSQGAASE